MLITLQIIGGVLGIASSALGFISFWREKIKHRTWFILGALILGASATYMYAAAKDRQQQAEIHRLQEEALLRDAKVVSEAIVVSGWEDAGDFVGYLAQITGFYERHADRYSSERDTYSRQLREWQDYLKATRESGKTLYSSDWKDLKGLVNSGRDQLVGISAKY